MKKWLFVALLGLLLWWWLRPEPPAKWPGRPAPAMPLQTNTGLPRPWRHGEYTVTPLARFALRGIVLARERYRYDPAAPLAPVDLALGWGRMSEAAVINDLSIEQDHRWYEYTWRGEPPIPADEIARSSANMHLIPADGAVRAALLAVHRHELVDFAGYLVEVRGPEGWNWRSSLSRDDTGGGACEVVWVESLSHRNP